MICGFDAALRSAQESLLRSESNFRSLVTNAPYGICRCEATGIVVDANPALVSTLGYDNTSQLVGRHLGTLYSDTLQWFQRADHFRSLKEFNGLAAQWVRKDGTPLLLRISGRTIHDKKSISYELFTEDVTERRALEQQLLQVHDIIRCPYCVLGDESQPMLRRSDGLYICEQCGHTTSFNTEHKCGCRNCEERLRAA